MAAWIMFGGLQVDYTFLRRYRIHHDHACYTQHWDSCPRVPKPNGGRETQVCRQRSPPKSLAPKAESDPLVGTSGPSSARDPIMASRCKLYFAWICDLSCTLTTLDKVRFNEIWTDHSMICMVFVCLPCFFVTFSLKVRVRHIQTHPWWCRMYSMQYACMCLQCMQRLSGKSGRQAFWSSVVKLDLSTRFEAVSCLLVCNLLASTSE